MRQLLAYGTAIVLLANIGANPLFAETYRFDLPKLEHEYLYGQSTDIDSLCLGVGFQAISSVQLELSGSQTRGFWVGDGVEDFSSGPYGGSLSAVMNTPSGPGDLVDAWYRADYEGTFTTIMDLTRLGGGSNWAFLYDGVSNISLSNDSLMGWGHFTSTPVYDVTNATLIVGGVIQTVPEPSSAWLLITFGLVALFLAAGRKSFRKNSRFQTAKVFLEKESFRRK